jgi:hypothetical protein
VSTPGQNLFDLLPALYRLRDATVAQSQALPQGPLQALLMLIDEQFALLADDLIQRYDDEFIETCAPWVIPYIGNLIGYQPVNGIAPAVANPRAEVADTVSLRRRKGTPLVLEQLARDVTGWSARAVEAFQSLATAQYSKHVRLENHYAPDLRRWQPGLYMDGAFDTAAHQVDVRRIASGRGRYNVQNIGVFLWSLNAYGVSSVPATAVDGGGQLFRLGSLGADVALFNNPVSQEAGVTTSTRPLNVPDRLRRAVLAQDLSSGAGAKYYGNGASVALYLNGTMLNPYQIQVCDLSGADGSWSNLPGAGSQYVACFDPELGRVALVTALSSAPAAGSATPALAATYYTGFGADLGGGSYERADTFLVDDAAQVLPFPDTAAPARYTTLADAVTYAVGILTGVAAAAVEITGDGVYSLASAPALQVDAPAGTLLELRAAQGCRPTLLLGGEITVTGGAQSTVCFNGLLMGYVGGTAPRALVHATGGTSQLSSLQLSHCTLVSGATAFPSLLVETPGITLNVAKSIVGPLSVSDEAMSMLADSIVDATGPTRVAYAATDGVSGGGALTLQSCTLIGKVHTALASTISDSILVAGLAVGDTWPAALWTDRLQQGCVRFSYLPAASIAPNPYECVVHAAFAPQPLFYSLRYGDPGYCKLWPSTDDSIRRGADDEGEMGAFHFVLAPMRENDLKIRLQEYLPAGLEIGIIYQT